MKKIVVSFISILTVCCTTAQTIINRDPEIKKMVDEISREKIEQYVRKMVSFYTRHNLSQQNDPVKGIGAAWNWIKEEMEKSIPVSGGRLDVKFEEYTVGGQGQRIPQEKDMLNR
jgi:hypothetical protein